MSKFDRKSQQLKARVQFVRGSVRKSKGAKLTAAEVDTMTDDQVDVEIALGNLEIAGDDAEPAAGEDGNGGKSGGSK